ncbi:hypothetical protein SPTER_26710 [Sporomusa termitida]|uniref:Uncharacterized protein n=1 Tax=Sporomusa termitida TaxID=2377 RepID=A0A517DVA5_9FIRM|nr:hypothetical protein SPTER_26710 [Sporomusa termitida]
MGRDVWDLLFRTSIAGAAITGCFLYVKAKAGWVRQCHLLIGVLAVVLCLLRFLGINPAERETAPIF